MFTRRHFKAVAGVIKGLTDEDSVVVDEDGSAELRTVISKVCLLAQDALDSVPPYYAKDGTRLTDCCRCDSTYHDKILCCKACWEEVPFGQGDGSENIDPQAAWFRSPPRPIPPCVSARNLGVVAGAIADMFKASNGNFSRSAFMSACGLAHSDEKETE